MLNDDRGPDGQLFRLSGWRREASRGYVPYRAVPGFLIKPFERFGIDASENIKAGQIARLFLIHLRESVLNSAVHRSAVDSAPPRRPCR